MRRIVYTSIIFTLCWAIFSPLAVAAGEQATPPATAEPPNPKLDVESLVEKVQGLYQHTKDVKGKFKQVYTDQLYGRNRTSYGYFFVKKPGMMRWNYVQPERKAFISDGKVLWVWEPADQQAFRNPLDNKALSSGLPFLLGSGRLDAEFNISAAKSQREQIGKPGQQLLRLVPKIPTAQYDYLLLAVRPSDGAVTESMVVSKNSTNHMIFSALVFNSRLQTRRFVFHPTPETRVIDGSKLAQP